MLIQRKSKVKLPERPSKGETITYEDRVMKCWLCHSTVQDSTGLCSYECELDGVWPRRQGKDCFFEVNEVTVKFLRDEL